MLHQLMWFICIKMNCLLADQAFLMQRKDGRILISFYKGVHANPSALNVPEEPSPEQFATVAKEVSALLHVYPTVALVQWMTWQVSSHGFACRNALQCVRDVMGSCLIRPELACMYSTAQHCLLSIVLHDVQAMQDAELIFPELKQATEPPQVIVGR